MYRKSARQWRLSVFRSVWRLFSLGASLVFELLDHNKRLLMTEKLWDSAEDNHSAHIWSHKTRKRPGRKREEVQADGLEMQLQATVITQRRDSVPSDLISGFRSIDEDLQGQTFLTWLLYTNSEQRERRREKDTVNPTACSALEQMLAHAWCLPCFYQTIKQL